MNLKFIGPLLKVLFNSLFAGKTVTVKGVHVTLPELDQKQGLPLGPAVELHDLVGKK